MSKAGYIPSTSSVDRRSIKFEPAASKRVLLAKLRKAQDPDGKTSAGEKFAMVVLSKTKAELRDWLDELERNAETGELVVDFIVHASESLKTRLQLVDSAFARLCVVADEQAAAGKRKGGANV